MTASFTQTSDESYDRHYYELCLTNGTKQIWENYEELRDLWISTRGLGMKCIKVRDRAKAKKSKLN